MPLRLAAAHASLGPIFFQSPDYADFVTLSYNVSRLENETDTNDAKLIRFPIGNFLYRRNATLLTKTVQL
jgi:hypothetical protein